MVSIIIYSCLPCFLTGPHSIMDKSIPCNTQHHCIICICFVEAIALFYWGRTASWSLDN